MSEYVKCASCGNKRQKDAERCPWCDEPNAESRGEASAVVSDVDLKPSDAIAIGLLRAVGSAVAVLGLTALVIVLAALGGGSGGSTMLPLLSVAAFCSLAYSLFPLLRAGPFLTATAIAIWLMAAILCIKEPNLLISWAVATGLTVVKSVVKP